MLLLVAHVVGLEGKTWYILDFVHGAWRVFEWVAF